MSNLGRYQDVVEEMYEAGGVDKWFEIIKDSAYNKGASDMKNILVIPLLVAGTGIGVVGVVAYQKISKWINDKKTENILIEQEASGAEKFLKEELDDAVKEIEYDKGVE